MDRETKREQLELHWKLHADAWRCRLREDEEGMLDKQREAQHALWTSRTYQYLLGKLLHESKVL